MQFYTIITSISCSLALMSAKQLTMPTRMMRISPPIPFSAIVQPLLRASFLHPLSPNTPLINYPQLVGSGDVLTGENKIAFWGHVARHQQHNTQS